MDPPHQAHGEAPPWRRWLTLMALAAWLGGFTCYALIVIPTAADQLGGHRVFGFVTRRVMVWFLGLAVVAAALLWPEWRWRCRRAVDGGARRAYAASLVALAGLWALYPWLNGLLDVPRQGIPDGDRFYLAHRIYLWTAMVHWVGTVWFARAVVGRWLGLGRDPAGGVA